MKCPKHNVEMILRTARKGKNAGSQFYGCPKYPRCKEIVDLKNSSIEKNNVKFHEKKSSQSAMLNHSDSVFLQAREKFKNYQVRFFQTMALSDTILEQVNFGKIDRKKLLSSSQWRLDYPIFQENKIDENFKTVLNILFKILTRGQLTLSSPFIEQGLKNKYKISDDDFSDINFDIYSTFSKRTSNVNYNLFDSNVEFNFYHKTLSLLLGDNYYKFIIPQIEFSSLNSENLSDDSDFCRADFLLCFQDKNIIIELDGVEHENNKDQDEKRDELLEKSGYEVLRIKNEEIEENVGPNIQKLFDLFKNYQIPKKGRLNNKEKFCLSLKIAHQIQIVILEALLTGAYDFEKLIKVQFDDKSVELSKNEIEFILKLVQDDTNKLISNICRLYKIKVPDFLLSISNTSNTKEENCFVISYDDSKVYKNPTFYLQEVSFNKLIAQKSRTSKLIKVKDSNQELLEFFLKYIFRFDSFMEGQYEAIVRALEGKDAIVLLPTGSGKSLAFQLAALILPGVSIVIDPIIALINDQIDNLYRSGIDRAIGITSQIKDARTRNEMIESFGQGEYIFCYVAPERLQSEEFRDTLRNLTVNTPISIIVIDEAHCVSEWGHDFRTSYLNIGRVSREYCQFENNVPPILALTGTASNGVLRDVQRELQINDFNAIITPKTFDRKELNFFVFNSTSAEKYEILKGCLQRLLPEKFNITESTFYQTRDKDTFCGLVFCPHVGGTFGVVENSQKISNELGVNVKFYGGRAPKGWNKNYWDSYKIQVAKDFKNNNFPLLVTTKSFGMGIDKPNVRYTIHYGIPNSVESFYQEAGRAGRDRRHAECAILISNDNIERTNKLLNPDISTQEINTIMESDRTWDNDDDVTRAMWFHANSFKGVKIELSEVMKILKVLTDLTKKNQITASVKKEEKNLFEKGLHRLVILGIVSDYTINYSSNEFNIKTSGINKDNIIDNYAKYVKGYNKGRVASEVAKIKKFYDKDLYSFVLSSIEVLINFIYDTIERGRRRALREMLTLAEEPLLSSNKNKKMDSIIRERILRYLEATYSEEIELILSGKSEGGFSELKSLVDGHETENSELVGGIRSPKDASEVRGQVARYLESTPDHPGLLFLRALSENFCRNSDETVIEQNVMTGISSSFNKYNIEKVELYNFLSWLMGKIYENNPNIGEYLLFSIIYKFDDLEFTSALLRGNYNKEELIYIPAIYSFSKISQKAVNLF